MALKCVAFEYFKTISDTQTIQLIVVQSTLVRLDKENSFSISNPYLSQWSPNQSPVLQWLDSGADFLVSYP